MTRIPRHKLVGIGYSYSEQAYLSTVYTQFSPSPIVQFPRSSSLLEPVQNSQSITFILTSDLSISPNAVHYEHILFFLSFSLFLFFSFLILFLLLLPLCTMKYNKYCLSSGCSNKLSQAESHKPKIFCCHSSVGQEVQDQGTDRCLVFAEALLPGSQTAVSSHKRKGKGALWGLLFRALIPFIRAHNLIISPHPNTIISGIRFQYMNSGGGDKHSVHSPPSFWV